ncbi:hypothetical protein LTR93_012275 [Exophiala xenobiotica]|nr:hypothetical protein LTR93_012275 [Exophiala xenobiotica]
MGSLGYQFQDVVVVKLSDEERKTQTLSLEHVGLAVSAVHRDGLVVLENAVDIEHMDSLNAILSKEAVEMAKIPTTHFNNNAIDSKPTGNMSQGPPLEPSSMFDDIWANGPAVSVISSILGPKPHVNYVNGNTALGNFRGARQRVHADLTFNHGSFLFSIVANYYLVDVSPANGSTELWLGTHRDTTFADHRNCRDDLTVDKFEAEFGIRDELLEARASVAPPIQPVVKKGSVVLRDLRLWHAGLSNPSPDPRIMLAFVHTPWWYQCPAKVVLPEAARSKVEQWASREQYPVEFVAHFVPANIDHKKVKFNPNFSSANKGFISMLPNLPKGLIVGEGDSQPEDDVQNVKVTA